MLIEEDNVKVHAIRMPKRNGKTDVLISMYFREVL